MDDLTIPKEAVEFKLVITHNVLSGDIAVEGHSKNYLITLGMLEYAKRLVNWEAQKRTMMEEMKNAPRIALSERIVS